VTLYASSMIMVREFWLDNSSGTKPKNQTVKAA